MRELLVLGPALRAQLPLDLVYLLLLLEQQILRPLLLISASDALEALQVPLIDLLYLSDVDLRCNPLSEEIG